MSERTYDLVVLGSGPAGLTAALYAHRAGLEVLVLGGNDPGGKVTRHPLVENYPPFPGGVTGAELMVRWIGQVSQEMGSGPLPMEAIEVEDLAGPLKKVTTAQETYQARSLIVATGSHPRRLGVPGEERLAGKGVFYCATCDAPLLRTMQQQRAAIVGGGDSAGHTALAVLPHAQEVTIISRGKRLRAQAALLERLRGEDKLSVRMGQTVKEIQGDQAVSGLLLEEAGGGSSQEMAVDAVFVGVGQQPNTTFLNGALELDPQGHIVTNARLATSLPGVFAAGDVRVTPLRQIVTASADGALAAQAAADFLRA